MMQDGLRELSSLRLDLPLRASAVVAALCVHQIFRRYETYSISVHIALLLAPPLALALYANSPPSPGTLVASFATYLITLAVSIVIYRLSPFHPLARHPGPVLHRVSKFWLAYRCLPGKQHEHIQSLHERYGDIVRVGPNELSIRDASFIPAILGQSGVPKGPHFFGRLVSSDLLALMALQDTDVHLQRRRPWTRAFTPSALKDYEELIAVRAKQLVSRLAEQRGPVMLDQWINYFTYDFMSDMAFGGGSELLSGSDLGNFWSVLEGSLKPATFLGHVPWLGDYFSYIPPVARQAYALVEYCRHLSQKRMERGSIKKDLFHYLSHEDTPGREPPPMPQLVDDGVLAVVAGSDTTASALTSLFCCLMAHPRVYDRLQAEIDRYYPAGEDVFSTVHHRDMPYLTAVINETLRIFPPVPGCTQRQVPHDGHGMTVGSLYLPPGTILWVHAYSMHLDPRNFSPAPGQFWPERWLVASGSLSLSDPVLSVSYPSPQNENADEGATPPASTQAQEAFVHNETAFLAFSHGPMNCVGKGLAMQEMRTVVCAILQRFRLQPTDGWTLGSYEREFRDYFVTTRRRVSVTLVPREKVEDM